MESVYQFSRHRVAEFAGTRQGILHSEVPGKILAQHE